MIKDRNGKDLTDVEVIKKMWQEYTEELHKTGLNDPDIHNDMVTHLKPDILVSEVKWGLESCTTNHANGGDRIPAEPFQTLKDDDVKVFHSTRQQIWKTQQWPATGLEKVSFHSNPKERQCQRMYKLPYNCAYFTC